MNGLLRHTSNIHKGLTSKNRLTYLGVVWNNIKTSYVFVTNSVTGFIKNIKL